MQAQLQELEGKILAHVAEMQGKSAREAAASLELTLQKEGVIGVTEEVRTVLSPTHCSPPGEPQTCTVPHCQLPVMFHDLNDMGEVMFALGLVWEGGVHLGSGMCVCLDTSMVHTKDRSVHGSLVPGIGDGGGPPCFLSQLLWVPPF